MEKYVKAIVDLFMAGASTDLINMVLGTDFSDEQINDVFEYSNLTEKELKTASAVYTAISVYSSSLDVVNAYLEELALSTVTQEQAEKYVMLFEVELMLASKLGEVPTERAVYDL
jgi:hypothetical protein